jgi:enoyl-CoA hydratase
MVDEILVEEKKKVYYITFNRPEKLNAINYEMMRQIKKAMMEAEENDQIQLVVFKGAESRAFSSGFDAKEILILPPEKKTQFWEFILKVSEMALTSEKLYMSLIRGFAVAGGFGFCLFCDFRIVEDNPHIYFALPEISLGLFPYSVLALCYYYLPPSVATSVVFGGEKLTLDDAEKLRFIHRRFKSEEFERSTKKYIRSITSQNPKVQRLSKICYNYERKNLLKSIQVEEEFMQSCLDPENLTKDVIMNLKEKWN